jgi:outer membrane protein assembly factor BamB
VEAKTGQQVWQSRVLSACSASPIYADGHIYFCDQHGKTVVLKPGRKLEVIAENQLSTRIMASPAVVDHSIFIRTETDLYRIENSSVAPALKSE